ncbi:MAG: bifunctional diaminohydroxyphosphoribosylaminopyrimidine deaminase/5-amino-6-(5-phosphoribosylamino)uracil reductase RibD [Desulfurobacteriaceae bacterium]
MITDEKFMKLAIKEAYKAKGKTLPNPAVGAVIVKDGKVIATGYHEKVGLPHAERIAIEKAGENAKGSILYVTLEPCNHYGKTPPCSEKIINAGIKKVVVGIRDPNPVARGGVERLKSAGIEVKVGVLEKECFELIDDFIVNLKEDRPFISLKLAATLDGKIADYKGNSKWITSKESRKLVHLLRSYHNAVMVGIGTVLKDDPLLNVREVETNFQPKAIVVDPHLKIPLDCRLIKSRSEDLIIITTRKSMTSEKSLFLRERGVKLLEAGKSSIELKTVLGRLRKEFGIYSIMCEGGSKLAGSLLEENLIDKFYLFYAPKVLGGKGMSMFEGGFLIEDAHPIRIFSINSIGNDLLIKAYRIEAI